MSAIFDRLVIWACCSALVVSRPIDTPIVVAMLAAVTISALNGYLKSAPFRLITVGTYLAAGVVRPDFFLFIPIVYYDVYEQGSTWRVIAGAAASAACLASLPTSSAVIILCLTAVAWILRRRSTTIETSQTELRRLRDSGHELTMQLTQKNEELLQKQSYEVRLATLNERGRIAREIHDHVGHLLSRSILQIAALMVTQKDNDTRSSLSVVRDTLSQAMDSIRSSVHDLHAESFELKTQVQALIQDFTFCPISLDYRLESEPDKETAYCFIAVIKEGLSNIIRHSNATRAILTLMEHPAFYQLVLQDNGSSQGSDYMIAAGSNTATGGIGLLNMEDRVAALGGQFLIERHGGFRLFVSVPKGGRHHEEGDHRESIGSGR